ncbi:MAG: hypothetical protein ACRC3K_12445, partial [Plesiomonas sp.]
MTELSKKIMLIALSLIGVTPVLVEAETVASNLAQTQTAMPLAAMPASVQTSTAPQLTPAASTTSTEISSAETPPVKNE